MSENIVLIAFAAFISAIVSGLGGFGGAFIIIIALTPIVGPKAVIPLIAVYAVCNNVSRIVIYRRTIDWRLAVVALAILPLLLIAINFFRIQARRFSRCQGLS